MEPTYSVSVHTEDGTNPLGSVVVIASERVSYLYGALVRINHTAKKRLVDVDWFYNGELLKPTDTFASRGITENGSVITVRNRK